METFKRERVKVDSGSLIYADRNVYSVPSRLIGEQVEARLFMDHVEVGTAEKRCRDATLARAAEASRDTGTSSTGWCGSGRLRALPIPRRTVPASRFRMTFDLLEEQLGRYQGSKEYLKILKLAARDSEVRVDARCLFCWDQAMSRSAPRASRPCCAPSTTRPFAMSSGSCGSQSLRSAVQCAGVRNERGPSDQNSVAGEPERTASAGHARVLRGRPRSRRRRGLSATNSTCCS